MQDVPKIVRERLKAPMPVDHPDADVLAAFAELSLPQSERADVLVHLSRCVDCRDIVALALPPSEATQPVIRSLRGGWLTWPALRWGFVAVGVMAIASVGLVQYQRRKSISVALRADRPLEAASEAKNQAAPPTPVTQPSSLPAESPAAPSTADKDLTQPLKLDSGVSKEIDTGGGPKAPVHFAHRGATVGGPIQNNTVNGAAVAWQQQSLAQQAQVPAPTVPQAFSTASRAAMPAAIPPSAQPVQAAPPPSVSDQQPQSGDLALAQNQPPSQTMQEEGKVSRSKPPETVEVTSASPAAEPSANDASPQEMPKVTGSAASGSTVSALVALKPSSQLRWTISPSGTLQRSYDQGSTWQDVNVVAALVPTSSFSNYDANAVAIIAKAKTETKKDKAARKRDLAMPVFRTVTAAGSDVWAGGSNAAMYHSVDGGDHWMQVLPSSGGTSLTGDVVALEFLDSQHGKVTTSTPEVWTTSDAGQTWQKQ